MPPNGPRAPLEEMPAPTRTTGLSCAQSYSAINPNPPRLSQSSLASPYFSGSLGSNRSLTTPSGVHAPPASAPVLVRSALLDVCVDAGVPYTFGSGFGVVQLYGFPYPHRGSVPDGPLGALPPPPDPPPPGVSMHSGPQSKPVGSVKLTGSFI